MRPIDPAAQRLANDPSTTPQQLADLAAQWPELGSVIAAHPNAYDGLLGWLAQYGDDAARAAVAARSAGVDSAAPQDMLATSEPQLVSPYAPDAVQAPSEAAFAPYAPEAGSPFAPDQAAAGDPFASAQPTEPFAANQTQPTEPFAPNQPYGQQYGGPGLPPSGPGYPGGPSGEAPKKSRKGLVIGLVIALVVVLGGGGVGVWALLRGGGASGASTPTEAVTNVIDGINSHDLGKLSSVIAPSESKFITQVTSELVKLQPNGDPEAMKLAEEAFNSVSVKENTLKFKEEKIADGVTFVEFTGGKLVIDGDAAKIAKAQVKAIEPSIKEVGKQQGLSDSDIQDAINRQRTQAEDSLKRSLPFTIDVDAINEGRSGTARYGVVAVKEDNWFISPMMTAAELVRQSSGRYGSEPAPRGTSIPAAKSFNTPEAAAKGMFEGLAQALNSGGRDLTPFAETLPLAERRLVSIYGGSLFASGGADTVSDVNFKIDNVGGKAEIDGDTARIDLSLKASMENRGETAQVEVGDSCFWITPPASAYDSSKVGGCLKEIELLRNIKMDKAPLIAIKENGGWLVSPLGTVADFAARFAVAIEPCVKDNRINDMCR